MTEDIYLGVQSKESLDFSTIADDAMIQEALLRRLSTPVNGYARWVRGPAGLELTGGSYGDKVYDYLSAPLVPVNIEGVRQAIADCAAGESRVTVSSVQASSDLSSQQVGVSVAYRINGSSSETQQVQFTLPN
jgi:hypothetical protein